MNPSGFAAATTKDGRVRVTHHGRHVVTVAGADADRLSAKLATADAEQAQMLLAKATGNFKRGNERRATRPG